MRMGTTNPATCAPMRMATWWGATVRPIARTAAVTAKLVAQTVGAMSLRHAVLGLLADGPASGYDLLKMFDRSLAFVWPASQSQLYGELNRLADDGLIEVSNEGPRGRKDYAITDHGRAELEQWITDVEPDRIRRNEAMLRVFFLGTVGPEHAKAYLEREATVHKNLQQLLETIERDTNWDANAFSRLAT